jgi:exonuclease III
MWFEIFPKYEKSFLICFVYRPPGSPSIWYTNLEKEMINALIMNKEIIFLGDLNINYIKIVLTSWESILTTHGFFQMIAEPTRVTETSVTLIDHIYTTNPENFIDIKVPCYV